MKTAKNLFFFLMVAIIFAACQNSSHSKQQARKLRLNLLEEPQTLDPRKARSLNDQTVMRMLFEGLTRIGLKEQPELAVAKEIQISPDLKTYTFHLRPTLWSNGDAVTAEDFVYTWKKILDPHFPSDYAFQLYVLKNAKQAKQGLVNLNEVGVQALDSFTLKVELEEPIPYFLDLLASPVFFPVNRKIDQSNAQWMNKPETYVSNGPFLLSTFKHQNFLQVTKNPSYWDHPAVALSEIELVMVREETELKMFQTQELDWAGSPLSTLPVDALKTLKSTNLLQTKPILGTYFLRTNVESAPFNHPWIRWAFALAVNRQAIVEHILQGNQIPATGIVPLSLRLQKEPYFMDGDAKMAAALFEATLKELGWKKSQLPEITLTYSMNERNHLIAQALQQQWFEAFGIRIKLEGMEKKVYFDRISRQNYQLAAGSWLADFNDAINFLDVFKHKTSSTNNTQWESAQFAQLLDRSSSLQDQEERLNLLSRSERLLIDEMPIIPIFYYTLLYVKNPELVDVVLTSMGNIDFKWARWQNKK